MLIKRITEGTPISPQELLDAIPPIRLISIGALDERFTMDEAVEIRTSTNDYVQVLNERLGRKMYIDLDDPALSSALDLLSVTDNFAATDKILISGRKDTIMEDGTEAEQYNGII